jgi:hypothetical protein
VLNIKHYAVKMYGGVDVYIHIILTSALVEGELSTSLLGRFIPHEKALVTHWVDPGVGLDDVGKTS